MPLLPAAVGLYPTAVARLLRGLALAEQARAADGDERDGLLSELDEVTRWLAARAADAPENFLHLLRLARGRAGLGGRRLPRRRAGLRRRAPRGRRPPAALASGPDHRTRGPLLPGPRPRPRRLRAARPGPPALRRLGRDREGRPTRLGLPHPATRTRRHRRRRRARRRSPRGRAAVTTGTLDLLGILSASQALSSQTSIDRLHARVVEVLGAMTGATGVHLLLWERRPARLAAARTRRRHRPGQRHRPRARAADVGAALRAAHR